MSIEKYIHTCTIDKYESFETALKQLNYLYAQTKGRIREARIKAIKEDWSEDPEYYELTFRKTEGPFYE